MKLLRRGDRDEPSPNDRSDDGSEGDASAAEPGGANSRPAQSEKKGRPTPKRREAERRRGPVAPAPLTAREARARRKATRGSKDERRAAAADRRLSSSERRSKMMAGEEAFLLPRDKGPVRGYVRDLVDSRRHVVGLFMPLAVVLLLALFLAPAVQSIMSLVMLVFVVVMVIEGLLIARRTRNQVYERFPDATDSTFSLGWYAFARAMQLRRMRTPRPRVRPGDAV